MSRSRGQSHACSSFGGMAISQPSFCRSLQQHVTCLSIFFDVRVISENGDYQELCERFRPDLTLVEFGVYGSPPDITNKLSCPEVPKLGFLHADAYCPTRSRFLADMERWGIESFFTISVSMPEYLPNNTDQLFIWPNFVDPKIYRDYGQPKNIPVLTTGSQAMHYPWRTRINELAAATISFTGLSAFRLVRRQKSSAHGLR